MKVFFKIQFLQFRKLKMFYFSEHVVIKGLFSRHCTIHFCDGKVFSLLNFQNISTVTSQIKNGMHKIEWMHETFE